MDVTGGGRSCSRFLLMLPVPALILITGLRSADADLEELLSFLSRAPQRPRGRAAADLNDMGPTLLSRRRPRPSIRDAREIWLD